MKLFIVLVVLVSYCQGSPNPPTNFITKFNFTMWNGPVKVVSNVQGYLGADDGSRKIISCSVLPDGSKYCYLSANDSPTMTHIYNYHALANGTVVQCNVTTNQEGWHNMWAWLPYASFHGPSFLSYCHQMLDKWSFDSDGFFLELGVSEMDKNMPYAFNYTAVNETTRKVTRDLFCFHDFENEPPSQRILTIPYACRKEETTVQFIPKNQDQRFFNSYFPIPQAIRVPGITT